MNSISQFLSEICFVSESSANELVARAFDTEILAALEGRPSSLRMLPACIGAEGELAARSAVVIDAGGTNLRVAEVEIGADGSAPTFHHLHKTFMPGSRGKLSAEEFHAAIAAEANAVLAVADAERLGYCFSYECRAMPDGDAELLAWAKQIDAPEVVGQKVGAELASRLIRKPASVKVLNDTVATLLAGKARTGSRSFSGYLGFILGTGTNVACVEDGMIRNAESGEFNKIDRSAADLALDQMTGDPGCAVFEKMVSGAYLGNLGLCLWREAAKAGLFSGDVKRRLGGALSVETHDLDAFASGESPTRMSGLFGTDEVAMARELALAVFKRAANLTAAHLAAFLRRSASSKEINPVAITVDGSTFWKIRSIPFSDVVAETLRGMSEVPPFEVLKVDEAPMVGAAVATCL